MHVWSFPILVTVVTFLVHSGNCTRGQPCDSQSQRRHLDSQKPRAQSERDCLGGAATVSRSSPFHPQGKLRESAFHSLFFLFPQYKPEEDPSRQKKRKPTKTQAEWRHQLVSRNNCSETWQKDGFKNTFGRIGVAVSRETGLSAPEVDAESSERIFPQ